MTALAGPYAEQHTLALVRANEIRKGRSVLCNRIAAMGRVEGALFMADVLLDLPECLMSLPAWKFVRLPKRLQRRVWMRWLASAYVSEAKLLGMLTPRQRGRMAGCMRAYATGELEDQ